MGLFMYMLVTNYEMVICYITAIDTVIYVSIVDHMYTIAYPCKLITIVYKVHI